MSLIDPTVLFSSFLDGESSPVELSSIEICLTTIVDSLTQCNPQLVKSVRDLVAELCRITLLWDEMWLAALMQRQGEVHRRLLQIEAETKRTLSIPNHVLTPDAKDAIMRQKYIATMKPVRHSYSYSSTVQYSTVHVHPVDLFSILFIRIFCVAVVGLGTFTGCHHSIC